MLSLKAFVSLESEVFRLHGHWKGCEGRQRVPGNITINGPVTGVAIKGRIQKWWEILNVFEKMCRGFKCIVSTCQN